jgi:hypothetical protein
VTLASCARVPAWQRGGQATGQMRCMGSPPLVGGHHHRQFGGRPALLADEPEVPAGLLPSHLAALYKDNREAAAGKFIR